jgi:molybdate transport system substrate-binding protein
MRRRSAVAALAAAAAALAGCGGSDGRSAAAVGDAPTSTAAPGAVREDEPAGDIVVFAAAPLARAFTTLGRRFHAAHPDVRVHFRFGVSATLAAEIGGGAAADVFATASAATMQPFVAAGSLARAPTTFVRDPKGDDYQIAPLADSTNIVTAAAFVDFVASVKGRQVLAAAGFQPATAEPGG